VAGDPEVGNDLEAPSKPLQRLTTPRVCPVDEGIGLFQRSPRRRSARDLAGSRSEGWARGSARRAHATQLAPDRPATARPDRLDCVRCARAGRGRRLRPWPPNQPRRELPAHPFRTGGSSGRPPPPAGAAEAGAARAPLAPIPLTSARASRHGEMVPAVSRAPASIGLRERILARPALSRLVLSGRLMLDLRDARNRRKRQCNGWLRRPSKHARPLRVGARAQRLPNTATAPASCSRACRED
jgi:hypothetical protein